MTYWSYINQLVPPKSAQATFLTKVVKLSVGSTHNCVITSSRTVQCWGKNLDGQLGINNETLAESYQPIPVIGLNQNVIDISVGFRHTCALIDQGATKTMKCWGHNQFGQLGDGSNTSHYLPIEVKGLDNDIKSISLGQEHSCALHESGKIKCWGRNSFGSLGDGTTIPRNIPVDVIGITDAIAISAGEEHTCAIITSGGIKCWGWNEAGTLGNGSYIQSILTPVDVLNLDKKVISIATRTYSTCALLIDQSVKCWGFNKFGQLGDGTILNRSLPVSVIGLDKDVVAIGAGGGAGGGRFGEDARACALTSNGTGKCWGSNFYGELGNENTAHSATPVAIKGISNAIFISGGGGNTCVLIRDGSVKCWGLNDNGRLGNGNTHNQLTPVDVIDLDGRTRTYLSTITTDLCFNKDCEPNDTAKDAREIGLNTRVIGQTNNPKDIKDYFFVPLQTGKSYSVNLNYQGEVDLDLYVYDRNEQKIASSITNGNFSEKIVFSPSVSDTFYISSLV